jgi:hypothetical protein
VRQLLKAVCRTDARWYRYPTEKRTVCPHSNSTTVPSHELPDWHLGWVFVVSGQNRKSLIVADRGTVGTPSRTNKVASPAATSTWPKNPESVEICFSGRFRS